MTPEAVAAGLSEAKRAFVLSLSKGWKYWPDGMASHERSGLRGFGQSGLIESRYLLSGEYHRLTDLGLEAKARLIEEQANGAS